jgi:hypothetical protein
MIEDMQPRLILRANNERKHMLAQRMEEKLSNDGTIIHCEL